MTDHEGGLSWGEIRSCYYEIALIFAVRGVEDENEVASGCTTYQSSSWGGTIGRDGVVPNDCTASGMVSKVTGPFVRAMVGEWVVDVRFAASYTTL